MIEPSALQGQVRILVEDLRGQVARDVGLRAELRREHEEAQKAERTAGGFETWLDDRLDQAAVAWVLGCVFVRFCEDNELVTQVWLGGEKTPDAPDEAPAPADRGARHRQEYLAEYPLANDRDWLRKAFTYLRGLRATAKIFDGHNPVWRFDISGQAAEELSDFFRRGAGRHTLRTPGRDTRFLGDLYQDLSAHARSTYALLQTPSFVEEFILDRAFEPAVAQFGLAGTSVIDPTCGSGHFLLGAFHRLLEKWRDREPGTDIRVLAERALGQVTGVDVNPMAVAIARFRLLIAMLDICGYARLEQLSNFPVRVATGDALLPWGQASGEQGDLVALAQGRPEFAYPSEDEDLLADYLRPGRYTVVVGNPPYITVKDKAANQRYRDLYSTCSGQYALSVPFAQRFFQLACRGDHDGDGAGWVGQITANSFMKREFGKKLINEFFGGQVTPRRKKDGPSITPVELTEVIDTSGAYIPGHGTPTVILVGRNRLVSPRYSTPIRTIMGVRGEPTQPADPATGLVWSAIVDQIEHPGSDSAWITCTDLPRDRLSTHPWSLTGGGADSIIEVLTRNSRQKLADLISSIGRTTVVGNDDAWLLPDMATARRLGEENFVEPFVIGECVRDFRLEETPFTRSPYLDPQHTIVVSHDHPLVRHLWPVRTILNTRVIFGQTLQQQGRPWFEHLENYTSKLVTPLGIAFAFVATHNHFVLDRGGKVFKQSAPVIKLPEGAGEDEHLKLLGILNSSTACFWLKQVSQPKAGSGMGRGIQPEDWMERYEFTGTKLERFPLPSAYPIDLSRRIDELAQRLATVTPTAIVASGVPTRDRLKTARAQWHSTRAQMIALQEELDWHVYRLYGLIDDDLTYPDPPELALGQRAFEITLARTGEDTQWFTRHASTPITEPPAHWPADYRALVDKRIAATAADRNLALIERPEHKRRWATTTWDTQQTAALHTWLLDKLETPEIWGDQPAPLSVAQLADRVRHDNDFRTVLDLWIGHDQHDLVTTLTRLVTDAHVPVLAAARYKSTGLRKRAQWERTWTQQRRQDTGEQIDVDLPPKYTSTDFTKPSYWRNRGKLDIPKERFLSYPGMGRDTDPTLLLGWAGWNHLDQARALATAYLDRKTHAGWPPDKLLPMLAALAELEPWLHQWHTTPQPGFPSSPADFFTTLIDTELTALNADRTTLTTLRGIPTLP